jgi:hypothetical protein
LKALEENRWKKLWTEVAFFQEWNDLEVGFEEAREVVRMFWKGIPQIRRLTII